MFKRIAVLVLMLAGGMAVMTPAVAQASEYRRCERRFERREWREHERWERRAYRPYYYDRYGRYCPR